MESIRHLRNVLVKGRKYRFNSGAEFYEAMDKAIEGIEREIAEHYMELPTDADGVPIKVGDECWDKDTAEGFEVSSIEWNGVCWSAWSVPETRHLENRVMHHKPRTLEDVLASYRFDAQNIYEDPTLNGNQRVDELEALDDKVAAEIRELLEVGE